MVRAVSKHSIVIPLNVLDFIACFLSLIALLMDRRAITILVVYSKSHTEISQSCKTQVLTKDSA